MSRIKQLQVLHPRTVEAINDCSDKSFYIPPFGDNELVYHAKNVYPALLWMVYDVYRFERDLAAGHYDREAFSKHSLEVYNEVRKQVEEDHNQNRIRLGYIAAEAISSNDAAFPEHLAFAFDFAERRIQDNGRREGCKSGNDTRASRIAVADVTRFPPPGGGQWSLKGIRVELARWHRLHISNKGLEQILDALGIPFLRAPGGAPKKTPD